MKKHKVTLVTCVGVLGAVILANNAMALTTAQCQELPGNMFLAAIERGDCDINIQTAAGPQEELILPPDGDTNRNRDGRNGGEGGGNGGGDGGGDGGNGGGGGNSRTAGRP